MTGAKLYQLNEAAHALGVPGAVLAERLQSGRLPEAVRHEKGWYLPAATLPQIATREGWKLDISSGPTRPGQPESLGKSIREAAASQAAVVLAKTQASAAQAQVQQLARQLKQLQTQLDKANAETAELSAELQTAHQTCFALDQQRAVAEARVEEIRQQLNYERSRRYETARDEVGVDAGTDTEAPHPSPPSWFNIRRQPATPRQ